MLTFAVNSHSTVCVFRQLQELPHNTVAWCAAVNEEEIIVVKASILEATGIVDLLVEPYDGRDFVFAEVGKVGLRGVQGVPWGETEWVIHQCWKRKTKGGGGKREKTLKNEVYTTHISDQQLSGTFSGKLCYPQFKTSKGHITDPRKIIKTHRLYFVGAKLWKRWRWHKNLTKIANGEEKQITVKLTHRFQSWTWGGGRRRQGTYLAQSSWNLHFPLSETQHHTALTKQGTEQYRSTKQGTEQYRSTSS